MEIYLGLGSNLGDRKEKLDEALMRLDMFFGRPASAVSDYIETEAWGFEGAKFLNAVVRYDMAPDPDDVQKAGLRILDGCKEIERAMGRCGEPVYDERGERVYEDRPVDIDILLMGECVIDHPRLKVPHPLMGRRDFVMIPLRQLKPDCK